MPSWKTDTNYLPPTLCESVGRVNRLIFVPGLSLDSSVQPADYSHVSSIEPSSLGGAKIASAIAGLVAAHDFASQRSVVWV